MPDIDVLNMDEALAAVGADADALSTEQTVALGRYVTAVTKRFDYLYGPVVNRTITSEARNGGAVFVQLAYSPVSSVTTVYERDGSSQSTITAEVYSTPTSSDYVLDPELGRLYRRSGGGDTLWAPGRRNVVVTYVAGRYASTAAVEDPWKTAAAITLQHLWRSHQTINTARFGMPTEDAGLPPAWLVPRQAQHLLESELRLPSIA